MKSVKFGKRFRFPLSPTSYVEYPAGFAGEISEERARAAKKARVLRGEPVAAPDATSAPERD